MNENSWTWFLYCVHEAVSGRENLCLITPPEVSAYVTSNRDRFPLFVHTRLCVKSQMFELYPYVENIEDFIKVFGEASHSFNSETCTRKIGQLERIAEENLELHNWFNTTPPEKWTQAFDLTGRRWGIMTGNGVSIFNHLLRGGRDLPITGLIKFTHERCCQYWVERRNEFANVETLYAPFVDTELSKNYRESVNCTTTLVDIDAGIARVVCQRKQRVVMVNLTNHTCTCGKWQGLHYPCQHAMAVIFAVGWDINPYIATEYRTMSCQQTWAVEWDKFPEEDEWVTQEGYYYIPNGLYDFDTVFRHGGN